MGKGTMMVALVALMVSLFAAAAYAEVISGGSGNDNLDDPNGATNDQLYGRGGSDDVDANAVGIDNDADPVCGGGGGDQVSGVDGDTKDLVAGNRGRNDTCYLDRIVETGERDTRGGGCEKVTYNDLTNE